MHQANMRLNLRIARLIAGSLAAGVVLLWVVAWVLTDGGRAGIAPDALPAAAAFWLWAALALGSLAGALVLRGRALRALEGPDGRFGGPLPQERLGQVQSSLLVAAALLEGPALFSGVLFLLLASKQILLAAIPVYAIGLIATFPRAEWFGIDLVAARQT